MNNRKKLYLKLTLVSIGIWIIASVLAMLNPPEDLMRIVHILGSLAPSWLFLFACLTLLLMKKGFTELDSKTQRLEDIVIIIMLLLSVLAEMIAQSAGSVSYALPLCAIAVFASITAHIAYAKKNVDTKTRSSLESKFTPKEIIFVIILGMISCVILGKFFASASDIIIKMLG